MALPTQNTNSISISAPASVPLPSSGYVTYFFNSSDSNKLYYKADDGVIAIADQVPDGIDDCTCCLMKDYVGTLRDALLSGAMTATEYSTALTAGFQVTTPGGTYSVSTVTP